MEFNCCTDGQLPDLSNASSLEISIVHCETLSDGSTDCNPLLGVASGKGTMASALGFTPNEEDLLFTVYARFDNGEVEPLHDSDSMERAQGVAHLIAADHPLPINLN